jgi:transglutaminase-like putative cysteine protease
LDKSSLLIATLRSNGILARYRHGTRSEDQARELILSMFPPKPKWPIPRTIRSCWPKRKIIGGLRRIKMARG